MFLPPLPYRQVLDDLRVENHATALSRLTLANWFKPEKVAFSRKPLVHCSEFVATPRTLFHFVAGENELRRPRRRW